MYVEYSPERNLGGNVVSVNFTDWSLPEPPVDHYTDELMNSAKAFSNTAIKIFLCLNHPPRHEIGSADRAAHRPE